MLSIKFFAFCHNVQLQGYLSPFPVVSAKGIDALSHTWDFLGYCTLSPYPAAFSGSREDSSDFAPGEVTGPTWPRQPWSCHWRTQYISCLRPALLLAPAWPGQPWYSSLAELSVAHEYVPARTIPSPAGGFSLTCRPNV